MAEDEDPEVAAALAKLAGQDAAAAEDARAALEWIAGDCSARSRAERPGR